jgi:uncharacterized membrane protein
VTASADGAERARSLRRLSSVRLEMFSDGVFAIAVTLLAVQLRPPNLDGVTTVGGLLHALFEQRTQFAYYALNFVNVGGVWLEHHELLDPMETHSRRLARRNLWFLLTVSLLPYSVGVLEAHPDSGPAGGLLLLTMAFTRITFLLVCSSARACGPSSSLARPPRSWSCRHCCGRRRRRWRWSPWPRSWSATRRSRESPRAAWWSCTCSRRACSSAAGSFGTSAA